MPPCIEHHIPAARNTGRPAHEKEPTSRPDELVALGASIGANCHPLLEQHVAGALQQGLIKMAQIVQQHAANITASKATAAIEAAEPNPAAVS